jgi:protein phosphatase inhibitor 2
MATTPEVIADEDHPVKPALKSGHTSDDERKHKKKKDLKWDEAKILEHDQLRGTRMKIEEPNTPYHHNYDSGSETDGSHSAKHEKESQLSWDHLQNKLDAAAAARDQYPSSPSSHGGGIEPGSEDDEKKKEEMRAIEFKEHRKRHYNEMELVRKFRQENQEDDLLVNGVDNQDYDQDNDADDEDERKPSAN